MSTVNHTFANLITDDEIITRLHNESKDALTVIFDRYHRPLRYFAILCLRPLPDGRAVAEDIVADSFINLWQRRAEFDTLAAVKLFLYDTVKNSCLSQLLKGHQQDITGAMIEAYITKAELIYKIWQDIEQLPPVGRRVFQMSYFENLNVFEIARILQIPVDMVRVQKVLAFHRLKAIVSKDYDKTKAENCLLK